MHDRGSRKQNCICFIPSFFEADCACRDCSKSGACCWMPTSHVAAWGGHVATMSVATPLTETGLALSALLGGGREEWRRRFVTSRRRFPSPSLHLPHLSILSLPLPPPPQKTLHTHNSSVVCWGKCDVAATARPCESYGPETR